MWEANTNPLAAEHGVKGAIKNSDNPADAVNLKGPFSKQAQLMNSWNLPNFGPP